MNNPRCTKCNESSIKNIALDKEFFYCQTCKEEIVPVIVTYNLIKIGKGSMVLQTLENGIPNKLVEWNVESRLYEI